MSAREAAWLAWYLCALSLTVLGLFLLVVSQSAADAPVFDYWLENTSSRSGLFAAILASAAPAGRVLVPLIGKSGSWSARGSACFVLRGWASKGGKDHAIVGMRRPDVGCTMLALVKAMDEVAHE